MPHSDFSLLRLSRPAARKECVMNSCMMCRVATRSDMRKGQKGAKVTHQMLSKTRRGEYHVSVENSILNYNVVTPACVSKTAPKPIRTANEDRLGAKMCLRLADVFLALHAQDTPRNKPRNLTLPSSQDERSIHAEQKH